MSTTNSIKNSVHRLTPKGKSSKKQNNIMKQNSEKSSGGVREFIAKLSRGLMLPIAMLPIAGLFLGIGNAIASQASSEFGRILGLIIKEPGDIVFGNLAVLFAIAIAITFTGDVGVAGLSSFVGWIVFCALQSALIIPSTNATGEDIYKFLYWTLDSTQYGAIFTKNLGIQSLCTSVFGGLTVGFAVAFLYNKFKNIQLPTILGFFSGIRFIPIITFLAMIPLAMLFSLVWPAFGMGLYWMGWGLGMMGKYTYGFNSFIFGFVERSLVPFGLHHAFYTPLWYTSVGGNIDLSATANIIYNGTSYSTWFTFAQATGYTGESLVNGDQSCWILLSQLAGKHVTLDGVEQTLTFKTLCNMLGNGTVNAGQYMQGKYPFMMFGLPAAALAMILVTPKNSNRKIAFSIIGSAALTSFLTGITEPLEFTFLFLAPWLYWGFHAFFCAMSFWMMNLFGAHMGMTFSGGFIDFIIYGALPDAIGAKANCWIAACIGLVLIPIYFFGFYFLIKKFDIKTPGREGNEIKLFTKKDFLAKNGNGQASEINQQSNAVIKAYGGKENIKNVDACITKLRVQVIDPKKVNKQELMNLGAKGVMYPSKQSVYAVFGTTADRIKNEMKDIFTGKAPVVTQLPTPAAKTTKVVTAKARKARKPLNICAPANGEVVSTKSVKDQTFSQDIMGKGFAIIPTDGKFVAPIAGKVVLVNNHAYAIKSKNGVEILVHIGIDTVKLTNKNVFKHLVKVGDEVKLGQLVVEANLDLIKKHKLDTITPVIVLQESLGNKKIKISKFGNVTAKAKILSIK